MFAWVTILGACIVTSRLAPSSIFFFFFGKWILPPRTCFCAGVNAPFLIEDSVTGYELLRRNTNRGTECTFECRRTRIQKLLQTRCGSGPEDFHTGFIITVYVLIEGFWSESDARRSSLPTEVCSIIANWNSKPRVDSKCHANCLARRFRQSMRPMADMYWGRWSRCFEPFRIVREFKWCFIFKMFLFWMNICMRWLQRYLSNCFHRQKIRRLNVWINFF